MEKWNGKLAVITGASGGIGKSLVHNFIKHGINVVALDMKPKIVEEFAVKSEHSQGQVYARVCDVTDLESVNKTFEWIETQLGSISILVNNAGFIHPCNITSDSENIEQEFHKTLDTNLLGPIYCSRAAIKIMKKTDENGIIINMNSLAGDVAVNFPGIGIYSASKHALKSFSHHLRFELISQGFTKIRVSSIYPSGVKTDMLRTVMKSVSEDAVKSVDDEVFAILKTEDIAQIVQFLLKTPVTVNITDLSVKSAGEGMA